MLILIFVSHPYEWKPVPFLHNYKQVKRHKRSCFFVQIIHTYRIRIFHRTSAVSFFSLLCFSFSLLRFCVCVCLVINLSWLNSWKLVPLNIPLFQAIHEPKTTVHTTIIYVHILNELFSLKFACNFIYHQQKDCCWFHFAFKATDSFVCFGIDFFGEVKRKSALWLFVIWPRTD